VATQGTPDYKQLRDKEWKRYMDIGTLFSEKIRERGKRNL